MCFRKKILGSLFFLGLLVQTSCITVNLLPQSNGLTEEIVSGKGSPDKLLLIPIDGFIGDRAQKGIPFLGGREDTVTATRSMLKKAEHDPSVRGVIFLIDSPGGSVTASDRIYHMIRSFRQRHPIPVFALVEDIGASGAYYIAMGADEVWVHPTSIVGSIGVVVFNVGVTGLMKKIGVTDRSITSGDEKEMGSPFRHMSSKDQQIFQDLVGDLYGQFLGVVSKSRQIAPEQLKPIADGRVYTAKQAIKLHLVDRIGYREDLVTHLERVMHVSKFELVRYREPFLSGTGLFGESSPVGSPVADPSLLIPALKKLGPTPLYFWSPSLGGGSMK
ncbi:MAG: signal peptide peptidase SppA [Nitrospiraceae bacterium]|nr:signal peptide peptidase SppA [Nitrospiraceae bacterium]